MVILCTCARTNMKYTCTCTYYIGLRNYITILLLLVLYVRRNSLISVSVLLICICTYIGVYGSGLFNFVPVVYPSRPCLMINNLYKYMNNIIPCITNTSCYTIILSHIGIHSHSYVHTYHQIYTSCLQTVYSYQLFILKLLLTTDVLAVNNYRFLVYRIT